MEFRKAVKSDIDNIIHIIKQAQDYFRKYGIDQWQNNYPNYNVIKRDIENNNSYVLLKDNIVIGTVAVIFDGEKTYETIYDGKWLSYGEYATIHRLAVDSNYKGLGIASLILKNIEEVCLKRNIFSIKVDTHKENIPMQKFLEKNGFKYCGIIYLEDNSMRIAYEKII